MFTKLDLTTAATCPCVSGSWKYRGTSHLLDVPNDHLLEFIQKTLILTATIQTGPKQPGARQL